MDTIAGKSRAASRRRRIVGVLSGLLFAGFPAFGKPAEPPSAEDLARLPAMDSVSFSPDGKRFAARVERKGQLVLAVVEAATNKVQVFNSGQGSDLETFRWLTDDLIALTTTKQGVAAFDLSRFDFRNATVSLDGQSRIQADVAALAVAKVSPSSDEIIIARSRASDHGPVELEVVDTRSGRVGRKLTGEPPGPRITAGSSIASSPLGPASATTRTPTSTRAGGANRPSARGS